MASDDMDHMQHLESVALSDCAVLQSKEATYQGSWKRAGGVSAWFMARRNIDRLLTMMAPKAFPDYVQTQANVMDTLGALDEIVHYAGNVGTKLPGSIEATRNILAMLGDRFTANDIFAKIRANPRGEDGTVLAVMRDMRRYFMLVEAEMIAEGAVEPEAKTYEAENVYVTPETDVYQLIADEKGLDREEVKDAIHHLFYNSDGIMMQRAKATVRIEFGGGNHYTFADARNIMIRSDGDTITIELSQRSPPPIPVPDEPRSEALVEALNGGNGGYAMEQAARHRDNVADGGSQHNSAFPWEVGKVFHAQLKTRIGDEIDKWWRQMTPSMWRLYPVVQGLNIPRELQRIYDLARENASVWVLRLDLLSREMRDEYPHLQREMNAKEFEGVGEFSFMYNLVGEKYMLRDHYSAWGAEA